MGNLNVSITVTDITKWLWVAINEYLSYILLKFEDFFLIGLVSGTLYIHSQTLILYPVQNIN